MKQMLFTGAALLSLIGGCSAPVEEDDDATSSAIRGTSTAPRPKPVCRLDPPVVQPTTALPTRTREGVQALVDAANRDAGTKRYTLESFGPYGHVDIGLSTPADRDVVATIRIRHVLPNGEIIPEQTSWTGALPAGWSGPLWLEFHFDPTRYGEDARFGLNRGVVEVECEGTFARRAYSFTR